jgi:hypothetical protein
VVVIVLWPSGGDVCQFTLAVAGELVLPPLLAVTE